jgi:hypothetical protein
MIEHSPSSLSTITFRQNVPQTNDIGESIDRYTPQQFYYISTILYLFSRFSQLKYRFPSSTP